MKSRTKKFLTEEILFRLAGLIDVFEFIFNPPRSYQELFFDHLYQIRRDLEKERLKKQINNAFNNLKRRGFFIQKKIGNKNVFFLSPKGIEKVLKMKLKQNIKTKKKKLKNKYFVVIFDIPEKMRSKRELFRDYLKKFKFKQLQKSVWVAPFDLFKEVLAVVKLCQVEPYVKFMVVQKISRNNLRDIFD